MIPKIVHQTSRLLTPEEARLGGRLRRVLPGWEYRMWSDEDTVSMVSEHYPQYIESFLAIQRGVVRADIARYMYLHAFGGFYFDTDYKLLATIDESLLGASCILPISRGDVEDLSHFRLGNAVMASAAGHRFWEQFLASIFSGGSVASLAEAEVEKTTGPEGLTSFFLAHRESFPDIVLAPRGIFHPEITRLGFSVAKSPDTVGAHLCWGSWRTKSLPGKLRGFAVRKLTSL